MPENTEYSNPADALEYLMGSGDMSPAEIIEKLEEKGFKIEKMEVEASMPSTDKGDDKDDEPKAKEPEGERKHSAGPMGRSLDLAHKVMGKHNLKDEE